MKNQGLEDEKSRLGRWKNQRLEDDPPFFFGTRPMFIRGKNSPVPLQEVYATQLGRKHVQSQMFHVW